MRSVDVPTASEIDRFNAITEASNICLVRADLDGRAVAVICAVEETPTYRLAPLAVLVDEGFESHLTLDGLRLEVA